MRLNFVNTLNSIKHRTGNKILVDVFFYLLASLIPAILLVLINPFLAQNLTPFDYAIIGYISSFAAIITPIVTFMLMRYYFVNYFNKYESDRDEIKSAILQSLILFSFVLSMLVAGGISIYHFYFNTHSTLPIYPYLLLSVSAIWLGSLFTFLLSEYRIQRSSRKYFFASLAQGIIKVLLLLLLVVLFKQGAIGYELALACTSLILFLICILKYKKYIFVKMNTKIIKEAFIFCWPIALGGCLEFFSNGMGRVMLERLDNNVEFGYYTVGNQFATYISLFTTALFTTFNPDIYQCASQNNYRKLVKIFFILLFAQLLVVSLFIVLAPYLVNVLTAGRYILSVQYAQILALSQVFMIMLYFINDVTIAYGYPKIVLYTKIVAGVCSIFILNTLIIKYEYIGASIGQSIIYLFYIVVNLLLFIFVYKRRYTEFYGN